MSLALWGAIFYLTLRVLTLHWTRRK